MLGVRTITVSSALQGSRWVPDDACRGSIRRDGCGDVKLFAAAGTLLGSGRIVQPSVVAIAGGILVGSSRFGGTVGRTVGLTLDFSDGEPIENGN